MPGGDAVRATAIARREVRNSMERLEYHLGRGARGIKGVEREVRFLDALHRQSVANSSLAVGRRVAVSGAASFGEKARAALSGGSSASVGRMKSSLLADFAADNLQLVRGQSDGVDAWKWQANASACPSCLARHGQVYRGTFTPLHPSCLCIPAIGFTPDVRVLTDSELHDVWSAHGDPRYSRLMENFVKTGRREDLLGHNAVNARAQGRAAVQQHLAKAEVRQLALGGRVIPAPTPPTTPESPAAPKKPRAKRAPKVAAATAEDSLITEALAQQGVKMHAGTAKSVKILDDVAKEMLATVRSTPGVDPADLEAFASLLKEKIASVRSWFTHTASGSYKNNGYWWIKGADKITKAQANALIKAGRGDELFQTYRGVYRKIDRELFMETRRQNHQVLTDWWEERAAYYKKRMDDWAARYNAGETHLVRPSYFDDEFNAWVKAHPEPSPMYDAGARELAETFIHEFTHVIDSDGANALRLLARDERLWHRANEIYNGGKGDPSFWYAASRAPKTGEIQPWETIAEMVRMFFYGDRSGVSYAGTSALHRTALEWRAAYPDLAEWVEKNVLRAATKLPSPTPALIEAVV